MTAPVVDSRRPAAPAPSPSQFWTQATDALSAALHSGPNGLSSAEAAKRLAADGPNSDAVARRGGVWRALARRLFEPLSLILLAAAVVSAATGDIASGAIIAGILILSIGLDTFQEGQASRSAERLRKSVALKAEVKRDGAFAEIPIEAVVRGDVVRVRAGDIIPADALILEASAFTADEAALTGEPYPVEKRPGLVAAPTPSQATNALFRGAVAQTGEAIALVAATGASTIFGAAAAALSQDAEQSPFERDLHAFGLLIARLTIGLVVVVLATHIFFARPLLESLLFAAALAVGLTPELLPMITTVTLSRGAVRMAERKVIVKRLASIHDLGAMTVLCTDKTGTLTSAQIVLAQSLGPKGAADPRPAMLGAIAAGLGGDRGAMDAALAAGAGTAIAEWKAVAQLAFDFSRRVGSVLAQGPGGPLLIAKGASEAVLPLCTAMAGGAVLDDAARAAIQQQVAQLAGQGMRAIAIATKSMPKAQTSLGHEDETGLVFEGLCAFADPPKETAPAAIARLAALGIGVKIFSGDDPVVVARLAGLVGLRCETVLSGADIQHLSDAALSVQVTRVDAYGRLTPDQKSRLIRALQASGAVVGYLGDGINDAPALKAAHIGLSVSGASGVAQAAADMILMESDLSVVAEGVEEGRRTFVNILKYVRMGASSNFGNMISMASASLFLPFLPMLPTQILLNNLLYDISEIGIPFDTVRPEAIAQPQVWDMRGLMKFAAVMGPLSSLFDLLTFAGLIAIFHATPAEFRTAWFLESMATQILVIFVIRTNGQPWRNPPSVLLTVSSLAALTVALALPFTPMGAWFGFQSPLPALSLTMGAVVFAYLICANGLKALAISRTGRAVKVRRGRARPRTS
ncbi:MAG: magnesium-translocating P-type ATPase [Caulobacteraceae bacterium]|nr:magnesium-translocating P-type ATPase [Caulobacteraceae bacterium]